MGSAASSAEVTQTSTSSANESSTSEKVFNQKEVGSLLNRAKHEAEQKAYERAKREYEQRQSAMSQPANQQSQNGQAQQQSIMSPEEIDRVVGERVDDKLRQAKDEATAYQIANEFNSKMSAAKTRYADFDDTVADLNLQTMLPIVSWANSFDNTADIMYDLAKNPAKLSNVMNLANAGQSQLAYKELLKLSQSIKSNESASKIATPNAPLSQLKASPVGADNGDSDVSALRKQPWLRG